MQEVTARLSVKGPHVSASSLLRQAFRCLVPRRLQVVQNLLKQDAVLQSLTQRGNIQMARLGSSLQLEVWGSHLGLNVDRKSGRFIVGAPSCRYEKRMLFFLSPPHTPALFSTRSVLTLCPSCICL